MDAEVQQPSYRLAYVGQILFPSGCFLRLTHRSAWWSYVRDRGGKWCETEKAQNAWHRR